jgi:spermidine synthase
MDPDASAPLAPPSPEVPGLRRRDVWILLVTLLVIATNGIIYELLIAGYSSYLLGDSIYQFSLTIGLYLSAMGLGSYLSRRVLWRLTDTFVAVEIAGGLLGGASVLVLSLAFVFTRSYELVMLVMTVLIGLFIGLPIPLVTRILAGHRTLRQVVADVLSYDYLGALVGSLAFPLLLLPSLGFLCTALAVGLVHLAVAIVNLIAFHRVLVHRRSLWITASVGGLALCAALLGADALERGAEEHRLGAEVVLARQSPYQRIVLSRKDGDYTLTLNGYPQFSTRDEHRYHEALVHPAMALAPSRESVLILGGGDGLALREVWKYRDVQRVHLVDIDPQMTDLAKNHPLFTGWNERALHDPRVTLFSEDAWKFLERSRDLYEVILVDLPDPTNISLSKLYSLEFYTMLKERLASGGMVSVQSTEISAGRRQAYWCILRTIRASGLQARPYSVFLPSLGLYAWTLASNRPFDPAQLQVVVPTRYLTSEILPGLFEWGQDLLEVETEVNRIDSHALLRYYFVR